MYDRYVFAGLDSATTLPKRYRRLMNQRDEGWELTSMTDVLLDLEDQFDIEWRDLRYEDESTGRNEPVEHYRALVNPAWEGKPEMDLPGDRADPIWHVPTKKYSLVSHNDAWRPLVKAIAKRGDHREVFGETRLRRQGGEVHMDVFFANSDIDAKGEDLTFGISTGHDYYGNTRLYADVIAYHDTGDGRGQIMRYLVDPRRRKHVGTAEDDVVEWYNDAVDRLDTVSDRMYNVVADAMHYEVPIGDMACSIEGFFEHLGLPNNSPSVLAAPASDRAIRTAAGPYTAWHLYKAGMWAIEHEYDPRDTSSFKSHVNTVNTLLFNPALAERRVLRSIEETLASRPDDEHEIWDFVDDEEDRESALEQVRTRAKSISEGVEEFQSTRERIQTLLTDDGVPEVAEEDVDEADDSDDDGSDDADEQMERVEADD